jgi:hypothetical protein
MDRLLASLLLAGKHLSLLDRVLQENYPPYAAVTEKLSAIPEYDELRKEVYAGGKKGGIQGYGRQMILGDLLQYIFTGRGYYLAVKGQSQWEAFINIIMQVANQLILMEDISVDVALRNKVLDTLSQEIGSPFFEDTEQEGLFDRLRSYEGKIVPGEGEDYDNILDSMLPKRVGAVPELLVYAHLVRKKYGYVVPLLHSQRLLGKGGYIVPPDFLLLRSKAETFGIEVGRGKEKQIGSFSTVTSIPVFTANVGSLEQPQPYRCGKCQRWITYCDEVIRLCSKNEEPDREYIDCAQCARYANSEDVSAKCSDVVYFGRAHDHNDEIKQLRYHYRCVKSDPEVQAVLAHARTPKLICPLPWVSGLEFLKEEP